MCVFKKHWTMDIEIPGSNSCRVHWVLASYSYSRNDWVSFGGKYWFVGGYY